MSSDKYKGLPIEELERLKEIAEWQISIAKCGSVVLQKRKVIEEINQQIKLIKNGNANRT